METCTLYDTPFPSLCVLPFLALNLLIHVNVNFIHQHFLTTKFLFRWLGSPTAPQKVIHPFFCTFIMRNSLHLYRPLVFESKDCSASYGVFRSYLNGISGWKFDILFGTMYFINRIIKPFHIHTYTCLRRQIVWLS